MFIQLIQGRPADAGELRSALGRWARELSPEAPGWLGTTAGLTEDGQFIAAVRFESREAAQRNADRPEQTQWWVETAKLFAGEIVFHDCVRVHQYLGGGSDSAGFVQVIQGRTRDPERMSEIVRRTERDLAAFRPDLIGGTIALHEDDGYTETAYFTSEKEAREGERMQPPPELRGALEEWMGLFEGRPAYVDLREPWLYSPGA
ncbi:hypothetical protein ABZ297_29465 [Nonomuraea sp. NPDC005983]|uniref:hypothetical protein n=1 Tax=Nonomuraea sp. NPDC005983 TaxID=3155595 RepID=UPI0033ADAEC4